MIFVYHINNRITYRKSFNSINDWFSSFKHNGANLYTNKTSYYGSILLVLPTYADKKYTPTSRLGLITV